MTGKMDRRQQRTKRLLHEALLELIEEQGIDKVTVSSLTKKADINRGTFYLHYTDIFDMLEQTKQEFLQGIAHIIRHINLQKLLDCASKGIIYPAVVDFISYINDHAVFFQVMLGPKGDPAFQANLKQLIQKQMLERLVFYQPHEQNMLLPREYLIAYVASANLGIIQHWIESGRQLSPEQLTLMIQSIIKHGPLASAGIKPSARE